MRKRITTYIIALLFFPGGIMQTFAQSKENNPNFTIIDDWNFFPNPDYDPNDPESPEFLTLGVSLWWTPEGTGSTAGILIEDDEGNLITYRAHETETVNPATGSVGSMKLAIQWNNDIDYEGTATHLVRQHMPAGNANIPARQFQPGQALEVFVHGDGSGNRFRFMTRDGIPTLEGSVWYTIDWVGWKRITWDYNNPENVVGWVNGDGKMDGANFYFDSFQVTKDAGGSAGGTTLYFDDFRIVNPFNIVFNIADADGTEAISINNNTYPEGHAEFQLFPGEYQYFVQKEGFVTASGTFEVDDEDITVDVTLNSGDDPEYTVTFTVLDEEGDFLPNAFITLNDETFAAKEYVFDLTPGFYNYKVNKAYYYPASGNFSMVDNNIFINVVLEKIPNVYNHVYLTWDVASTANTPMYREEHYSVWIAVIESLDQPYDAEDYVMVYEETLSSNVPNWQYQPRMVEISDFEQQDIRVAFRHHESTDKDRIVIDNVSIEGAAEGLETPDIIFHEYFMAGVPDFDPQEEEIPVYDYNWLPEGWMALDTDEDDFNWYYSIVIEQDYTITAHMRSSSWNPTEGPLTPDNWLVTPVIELPMVIFHTIIFEVKDEDGAALEGAVITLNGLNYNPGQYVFSLTNGIYQYAVSIEGYQTTAGSFEVTGESFTEEVVLELIAMYDVTFIVDMMQHDGFEPGQSEIYITGTFPGWEFSMPGTLDDQLMGPTDNVFLVTKTLSLPAGEYEYKYFYGPSFDYPEWPVDSNRVVVVEFEDLTVNDIWGIEPHTYDFTVYIVPEGAGYWVPSLEGPYFEHQVFEIEAFANIGWEFSHWAYMDDSNDEMIIGDYNPLQITMPGEDVVLFANFVLQSFTIAASANTGGSITPAGNVSVLHGSNQNFIIAPHSGHYIADVEVDGESQGALSSYLFINITDNHTIHASFEIFTFTLYYDADENGTINGEEEQTVNWGGTGTAVEAVADVGFHFVQWSDGSTDNPRTDTNVSENISVSAQFSINTHILDISIIGQGQVKVNGEYYTQPLEFEYGTNVTLEALPENGWQFENWTGDNSSTQTTITLVIEDEMQVAANFELIDYTLTVAVAPQSAGTVTGHGIYNMGDMVSLTATANTGYEFISWTNENDVEVSNDLTFVFVMPADNVSLTANYAKYTHVLDISIMGQGQVKVNGANYTQPLEFEYGTNVTLEALPNNGWQFENWTGDISSNQTIITLVIEDDMDIVVNFSLIPVYYTLILNTDPANSAFLSGGGNYTEDSQVEINATPNTGYLFSHWKDQFGNTLTSASSWIFTMPAQNSNLTAVMISDDATALDEPNKSKVIVYPNPAKNKVYITSMHPIEQIRIYSTSGQVVMEEYTAGETQFSIDIEHLLNGIYIVELQSAHFHQQVKLLVR